VSVRCGDFQYPQGPADKHGGHGGGPVRLILYHRAQVRRGCGDQRRMVGAIEQPAGVVTKYRYPWGVDDPVAVTEVWFGAVVGVERRDGVEAGVQGGGARDVLFLCPGAGTEAAAGVSGGGEHERGCRVAEPAGRGERRLGGDLDQRGRVRRARGG
jgi:hypothetical protein